MSMNDKEIANRLDLSTAMMWTTLIIGGGIGASQLLANLNPAPTYDKQEVLTAACATEEELKVNQGRPAVRTYSDDGKVDILTESGPPELTFANDSTLVQFTTKAGTIYQRGTLETRDGGMNVYNKVLRPNYKIILGPGQKVNFCPAIMRRQTVAVHRLP